MKNKGPLLAGLAGSSSLLLFYFLLMRFLTGTWESAFSQFEKLWYFMAPLILGFGIQVGLYKKIQEQNKKSGKNIMMTNTVTSSIGMVACCAHHLTDVLPFLGLSALSLFFIKYQSIILIIGIISNILGIKLLLEKIRKSIM